MGKVLIPCAGEQSRWRLPVPKQTVMVGNEQLLSRTVRQIRKRMSNYPHIVSNQKCLRIYSPNYICPRFHADICETLLSVEPIWGKDWTMVLMGDVYFTDELIDTLYNTRDHYDFKFYGTSEEIYAFTYTDNTAIKNALLLTRDIYEAYHCLSNGIPEAGMGYLVGEDALHYTYVLDGTVDFNTVEDYREWKRKRKNS